jgi:hypothetical protein
MYKKVFISFLLLALINFVAGCYSFQPVNVNEYKRIEEEDGKQTEIYVTTKDYKEYHFLNSNFYIENDTLFGKAKVIVSELPFEGKFALEDIETIQVEYFAFEYSSPTTVSQYHKIEAENGKPDEIYLIENDNERYHFIQSDYYIENDTLYGKGQLIVDKEELVNEKIPLSEIGVIETEKINWTFTTCLGLGIFTFIVGIIVLIALVEEIN